MKKILVPTDFSDGAFNALIHALHIAKKFGATVDIIHAYSIPPTGTAVMVDLTDILRKNANEELSLLRERVMALNLAEGITINYIAEHGTVIDSLERATRKHSSELVIMGTQGASGITEKWLGSNTAAAARNLDIPMLAVPAESPYQPYSNIVFATDFKIADDQKSMGVVKDFVKNFDAQLRFLHVMDPDEKSDNSITGAFRERMHSEFGDPEPTFTFVVDDDIDEGIEDALDQYGADLLITVRHKYGFFEGLFRSSVSQKIINSASLPILIIKG